MEEFSAFKRRFVGPEQEPSCVEASEGPLEAARVGGALLYAGSHFRLVAGDLRRRIPPEWVMQVSFRQAGRLWGSAGSVVGESRARLLERSLRRRDAHRASSRHTALTWWRIGVPHIGLPHGH